MGKKLFAGKILQITLAHAGVTCANNLDYAATSVLLIRLQSKPRAWMLHPTNVAEDRRHECLRLTTFLAGNGSQADFERHGQHFSSSEGKV